MTLYAANARDGDPVETREWIESMDAVLAASGPDRARYLLARLLDRARHAGFVPDGLLTTDYVNTIPVEHEPAYPGDEAMEERIGDILRWNAALMVTRANERFPGLGGHISTFASAADIYDVAFHHFFRGKADGAGDQIFFQGHASPGIYARAHLEGRLSDAQLDRFRRETERGTGLSSYPHPRLMPDFWEFPTVSMGLGPINSIYQARFNRYLHARGLCDTSNSRVWAFVGDGESDEPETLGALSVATREGLDNLTWIVNCNLQRLDGPVRGNGKIVQELETVFRGAGWNVIKVLWGSEWDDVFARDEHRLLVQRFNEIVDGQMQRFRAESGAYIRKHVFGGDPRLLELVAHLSDDDIWAMRRGGHDLRKIHAAMRAAVDHKGRPSVILAQTVKGFALGEGFEASNVTHQMKQMSREQLRGLRDRLDLHVPDHEIDEGAYYHPGPKSPEVEYLRACRERLGGSVPVRRVLPSAQLPQPDPKIYAEFDEGSKNKGGVSTTMAFVRLLTKLLKDKAVGKHIVPIVPDEARTFGMEPLFRQVGIYAAFGQLYEPGDRNQLLYYRESTDGQVLEEGITEAGSMASFTAAGTAYATHGQVMVPFYTFYSMFGFQRIGDLAWAFADARGRGFLLGATAGRTTLNGEGLQHEDGHSHVLASTIPNLLAYDPAYAYEIASIIREGMRRMYDEQEDVFYYLTLQNENYPQPPRPEGDHIEAGILGGIYLLRDAPPQDGPAVQLFGSACVLRTVLAAQELLAEQGVAASVWSVTSYTELRRDALEVERWNRFHPEDTPRASFLASSLGERRGPFVAATDYMKSVPDQIARFLPGKLTTLGTDGFGMSDTREALRKHFEIDAPTIAAAAIYALAQEGALSAKDAAAALKRASIDGDKRNPVSI